MSNNAGWGPTNGVSVGQNGQQFGTITAMPTVGTGQTLAPGTQTPMTTPDWLTSGLWASSQPLQNNSPTAYGRWGASQQPGATNGWGMTASPWPNAQQTFGQTPVQPTAQAQPQPSAGGPSISDVINSVYNPNTPNGSLGSHVGTGTGGAWRGTTPDTAYGGNMLQVLQARAANGNQNAAQTLMVRNNPQAVQAGASQFGRLNPAQQAQYLQNYPQMATAMQNAGLLNNAQINNLRGGSVYQSQTGQALAPY